MSPKTTQWNTPAAFTMVTKSRVEFENFLRGCIQLTHNNRLEFEDWIKRVYYVLLGRYDNDERRVVTTLARQPLWDYWSSGYHPEDAAREM